MDTTTPTRVDDARHPAARRVVDVLRPGRGRTRTFVVDDIENVITAARAGIRLDAAYATEDHVDALRRVEAAATGAVPQHVLTGEVVRSIFRSSRRSDVFALAHAPRPARLDDVLARDGDVVILDGVRTPGNLGAIVRSARAFGAAGVVAVDSGLTSVVDRRLVRASRALVFEVPVVLATAAEVRATLTSRGVPLVALTTEGTGQLDDVTAPGRVALLLGSERRGPSSTLARFADVTVSIPMARGVESLNVSVAAGVALHVRASG